MAIFWFPLVWLTYFEHVVQYLFNTCPFLHPPTRNHTPLKCSCLISKKVVTMKGPLTLSREAFHMFQNYNIPGMMIKKSQKTNERLL